MADTIVNGCTAAIITTDATQVIASPGAGLRNYITSVMVTNSHATVSTLVSLCSAATVIWRGWAAAGGGGFAVTFPIPLACAANEALNAGAITTGASVYVSAVGYYAA
jgi:hypothetical protein